MDQIDLRFLFALSQTMQKGKNPAPEISNEWLFCGLKIQKAEAQVTFLLSLLAEIHFHFPEGQETSEMPINEVINIYTN